jgi:hypothetical protein
MTKRPPAPRTGRPCTVCDHAERAEIDKALVRGTPYRNIAERFGLSVGALSRHKGAHLPKLLTEAAEAEAEAVKEEERLTAAALLNDLRDLQQTARRLGQKAEDEGDLATALRAVAELRGLLAVGLKGVETAELEERLDALEDALTSKKKRTA